MKKYAWWTISPLALGFAPEEISMIKSPYSWSPCGYDCKLLAKMCQIPHASRVLSKCFVHGQISRNSFTPYVQISRMGEWFTWRTNKMNISLDRPTQNWQLWDLRSEKRTTRKSLNIHNCFTTSHATASTDLVSCRLSIFCSKRESDMWLINSICKVLKSFFYSNFLLPLLLWNFSTRFGFT